MPLERGLDLLRRENRAPCCFDDVDLGPATPPDLGHELAETSEARNQNPIAGLDHRRHHRLDGCARGAVDDHRPLVSGLKHLPVERHGVAHVLAELGIELAEQLRRHRAQHAWIGIDRAGAHEEAR